MRSLIRVYDKLPGNQSSFNIATKNDVKYCYRLFLNREPDPDGWNHYTGLVSKRRITIQYLVNSFITSAEFKQIQDEMNKPVLVEMRQHNIFVRMNDPIIGGAIFHHHSYEPHVTSEIDSILKPGMTFVDIGANIGFFTLRGASLVGPNGQVIAYEPNPDNCALIQLSSENNRFENIRIYQNAVAEAKQTFDFSVDISNGRILHESNINNELANYTVDAVTLDESLPALARLDLIKMDIEGAEPRAWQGMQQTIQQYRPTIIFEFSPSTIQLTSQTDPEKFLASIQEGYDLFILHNSGEKSSHPQSLSDIMRFFTGKLHHLDIAAYPR